MKRAIYPILLILLQSLTFNSDAQDSLSLKGQVSAWMLYNGSNSMPVYSGVRYIPQLNYEIDLKNNHKIDFEASFNVNGSAGIDPFDELDASGQLKPYRTWARYSTNQFELRVGLQKLNFGSALMMRPLMWFDEVDARDPLKLTDGVWGLLGRYYFLNNANIWFWGLYGNNDARGWEFAGTNKHFPEIGGRFQVPVPKGEAAISYHYRVADTRNINEMIPRYDQVSENRIGFDIKLDMVTGIWFEGSWVNKNRELGPFSNQEILNAGIDYTFGLGNGLYVACEQLLAANDEKAFRFQYTNSFSLFTVSYPVGLFDNLSGIIYYDWKNKKTYNFINWQKQFNKISLYLIGFWNPEIYKIPLQGEGQNLFTGKGIQIMLVMNH